MMRRTISFMALALLGAALALASPAVADKPVKDPPAPLPDDTGQFCEDFEVLIHETENKASTITFSDGRVLSAGKLKLELTNVETGETIAVNASAPSSSPPMERR